jgi:hypothetical protein
MLLSEGSFAKGKSGFNPAHLETLVSSMSVNSLSLFEEGSGGDQEIQYYVSLL